MQNEQTFLPLQEEVSIPKETDQYPDGEMMLPIGNQLGRGNIVAQKRDANGNVNGTTHTNPIQDTKLYQVEFPRSKNTELTTNVIEESVYAQCDAEGNQHLFLDLLVDHLNDGRPISLTDQEISG